MISYFNKKQKFQEEEWRYQIREVRLIKFGFIGVNRENSIRAEISERSEQIKEK